MSVRGIGQPLRPTRAWILCFGGALLLAAGCGSLGISQVSPSTSNSSLYSPSQSGSVNTPSSSATPSASPSPSSPLPTPPSDWKTVTDLQYGYTFSYPSVWTEVSHPDGAHYMASRPTLTNPFVLEPNDWWLGVLAAPPNQTIGCGEPLNPDERYVTYLGDQAATEFAVKGSQHDPDVWVLDVITLRGGSCYQLQLMTGSAISENSAKATLVTVQSTFLFGP